MDKDEGAEIEYLKLYFKLMPRDDFNPDEALTWEYCFMDADAGKLKKLAQHLESLQYQVVDFFEDDDPDEGILKGEYILAVQKVEKHTPETLAKRNAEFSQLASQYSYAVTKTGFSI